MSFPEILKLKTDVGTYIPDNKLPGMIEKLKSRIDKILAKERDGLTVITVTREDVIIETMDYSPNKNRLVDSSYTNIDDYKNVPFTEKETNLIKSLLYGWSGAPNY